MLLEDNLDQSGAGEIILALEELRAAIERLHIQQPIVHVEPPDLGDLKQMLQVELVNTLNGLRPGLDAEAVAEAFARKIAPPQTHGQELELLIDGINELKKTLDHRLRGITAGGSGGGATLNTENLSVSSDVSDRPARELGRVTGNVAVSNADMPKESTQLQVRDFLDTVETKLQSLIDKDFATQATLATRATEATLIQIRDNADTVESLLADVKRGVTDQEQRLDYDASNNLIYFGQNLNGTATSAGTWLIKKLSYTGSNLTRVQVLSGISWDGRVGAAW